MGSFAINIFQQKNLTFSVNVYRNMEKKGK